MLNASSQMVSPADSTKIVVNRPEITAVTDKKEYRVIVTRSFRYEDIAEVVRNTGSVDSFESKRFCHATLHRLSRTFNGRGIYDFVDIVFRPRGEIVSFYIQYALDPDDLDLMGGTSITFTVIDMGNL